MKPTTSAVVFSVGSSTYNPNACDGQSLTAQWVATMPGVLTVMSSVLYWLQGQPVPSPPGYAVFSHLVPGVHLEPITCLGRVPNGTLVLAWGVQGRQGHPFT